MRLMLTAWALVHTAALMIEDIAQKAKTGRMRYHLVRHRLGFAVQTLGVADLGCHHSKRGAWDLGLDALVCHHL